MAHTRKLTLMIGESGSGKSTLAKQLVTEKGWVRVNRDDLRLEHIEKAKTMRGGLFGRDYEDFIAKEEKRLAAAALAQDLSVIVDNTHLNPNTVDKWRNFANHKAEFDIYRVFTPMDECIRRDALREGKSRVGRPVVERQFLVSGRHPLAQSDKPIVLVDVDGTLANHMDENGNQLRSPYAENVEVDGVWQSVVDEVNRLHDGGVTIIVVSGRKSTAGVATVQWLEDHGVKFDAIFMRHGWDNRADTLVKQDILRELTALVPQKLIKFVIDDRPKVVRSWMEAGLEVRPVFAGIFLKPEEFTVVHKAGCAYTDAKGYRRCPTCLALEDF